MVEQSEIKMTGSIKMRDSNIELLRIVCMIMILNLHTFLIPEYISLKSLSLANILTVFSESLSVCAVNTFVLISGYYSIKWKWRSFFSLIYQVYFFVFLIYIVLLATGYIHFNWKDLFLRSNCVLFSYWFISSYVVLYVFSPILNIYTSNVERKELGVFLIAFFILEFYFCTSKGTFNNGYSPLHFIGLYILGRFLKAYPLCFFNNIRKPVIVYVLLSCCIAIFFTGYKILKADPCTNFNFIGGYANPFVVIQSIALFYIFQNFTFQNKFVNWCGVSVLSIYLCHMHPDIKQLYYSHAASLYSLSVFYRFIHLTILFTTIFITSILLDKIRMVSFDIFYQLGLRIKDDVIKSKRS